MDTDTVRDELKSSNYEFFILALSILSIINWLSYFLVQDSDIERIVLVTDLVLSFIFLMDFLYRLLTARSKYNYFFRQYGWLDLLSSLPLPRVKILRVARVIRALRLIRDFGLRNIVREFLLNRAGSAVYIVSFMIILVMQYGSIAIIFVERGSPEANIKTTGDALWWVLVTISTVGYGDRYPVTHEGRVIAMIVIILGVALFGVVTGFLATAFDDDEDQDEKGQPIVAEMLPEEYSSILEEIARLREAQQKANVELNSHLARLVDRLEQLEGSTSDSQ